MAKFMKLAFVLLAAAILTPSIAVAGPAAVPDAGSTCSLFGVALTGLIFLRRKLR
jgi:hypothetical protein